MKKNPFLIFILFAAASIYVACSKEKIEPQPCTQTIDFSMTAASYLAPCTVTFDNLTTTSKPEDKFYWDFGGVSTSTNMEPGSVTFTQPGTYTIILRMTNATCSLEVKKNLTVLKNTFERRWGTGENDGLSGVIQRKNGDFMVFGASYTSDISKLMTLDSAGNLKSTDTRNERNDIALLPSGEDGWVRFSNHMESNNKYVECENNEIFSTGSMYSKIDYGFFKNSTQYGMLINSVKPRSGGWVLGGSIFGYNGTPLSAFFASVNAHNGYLEQILNQPYTTISGFGSAIKDPASSTYFTIGDATQPATGARIRKISSLGDVIWEAPIGGGYGDLIMLKDGNLLAVYSTGPTNDRDIYLEKLSVNGGASIWKRKFGGSSNDTPDKILEMLDGSLVIAGDTNSKGAGSSDIWLIKTDSQGQLLWDKTYGGSGHESVKDFMVTKDGGFAIVGQSSTSPTGGTGTDFYFIKTDKDGNL